MLAPAIVGVHRNDKRAAHLNRALECFSQESPKKEICRPCLANRQVYYGQGLHNTNSRGRHGGLNSEADRTANKQVAGSCAGWYNYPLISQHLISAWAKSSHAAP